MTDTDVAGTDGLGPAYAEVPRNAAGDPVFLILPDSLRVKYAGTMRSCEAGWRATGDPLMVAEAMTMTFLHRQVAPAWLDEAVWLLAYKRRSKAVAKRAIEASIRAMRYETVRDAHSILGLSWERARIRAEKDLAGTNAAGDADTIWAAYKRVKADLKAGRGGLYVLPKRQNRPIP